MFTYLLKCITFMTCLTPMPAMPPGVAAAQDAWVAPRLVEAIDDAASLSGIWVPIYAEHEGQRINPADDNWHCVITGKRITHFREDRVHVQGTIDMQPAGDAGKRMYWKYSTHPVTDSVIYSRPSEDLMIACWTGEWEKVPEWPQGFATNVETGGKYLVVWRRVFKQVEQQ